MKDWLRKLDNLEREYRRFPRMAGNTAVRFSKERFRTKDWVDVRTQPWKKQKVDYGNGLMVGKQTASLRKSIKIVRQSPDYVVIGTDKPYARAHNEGARIKVIPSMKKVFWRKHYDFKKMGNERLARFWLNMAVSKKPYVTIPQRRFMGPSAELAQRIEREMLARTIRALR